MPLHQLHPPHPPHHLPPLPLSVSASTFLAFRPPPFEVSHGGGKISRLPSCHGSTVSHYVIALGREKCWWGGAVVLINHQFSSSSNVEGQNVSWKPNRIQTSSPSAGNQHGLTDGVSIFNRVIAIPLVGGWGVGGGLCMLSFIAGAALRFPHFRVSSMSPC